MDNYKKLIISDRYCLIGIPDDEIEKRKVFGLDPGAKVVQIGDTNENGKETSQNRIDRFLEGGFAEYLGVIQIVDVEFMAFHWYSPEGQEDIELVLLYTFEEELQELYSSLINYNGIRIYQAKFKILEG